MNEKVIENMQRRFPLKEKVISARYKSTYLTEHGFFDSMPALRS